MSKIFNIYCDESAHLPSGNQPIMVLGAIWCEYDKTREIAEHIRKIKEKHGINPRQEIKWTKVSGKKLDMYLELADYFFDNDSLRFRALLIPNKENLDHQHFGQDHDTWYFKMYYRMLEVIITPKDHFRIYLNIKDTRSARSSVKIFASVSLGSAR
jgi:hypothetical protein